MLIWKVSIALGDVSVSSVRFPIPVISRSVRHTHTHTHTHTHFKCTNILTITHHKHAHTLLLKSARLSWWHTQTQVDIPVFKTGRYTLMHGQVSTGNLTSYTKHYVKCVKPCPCHVAQRL